MECKGRVYLPPASGSCYSYHQERKVDGAVWTERGWTSSDCEKESTASRQKLLSRHYCSRYTEENRIFLIYKEIQSGSVANSYMTNGLLIYGEIFAHFLIY